MISSSDLLAIRDTELETMAYLSLLRRLFPFRSHVKVTSGVPEA